MRILTGAQPFGFGPSSKLVAIAQLLSGHHLTFVGQSAALQFVQDNGLCFDHVISADSVSESSLDAMIRACDLVISVMNPELVFRAKVFKKQVLYIDSLFGFWLTDRSPVELNEIVERNYSTDAGRLYDVLASHLSTHELMMAGHLAAAVSLVQNGPGVSDRIRQFPMPARSRIQITGPIIDSATIDAVASSPPSKASGSLLINIGGVRNSFRRPADNPYLRLIERWSKDLSVDWPIFNDIVVCGGPYARLERVQDARIHYVLLDQPLLLRTAMGSRFYFMAPGLTSLNEAAALGIFPLGLPEQHYGHMYNLRALRPTKFGQLAFRFADCMPGYDIPKSDKEGTLAIHAIIDSILADSAMYSRFRISANEKIKRFIDLSGSEVREGIDELRTTFAGPAIDEMVQRLVPSRRHHVTTTSP